MSRSSRIHVRTFCLPLWVVFSLAFSLAAGSLLAQEPAKAPEGAAASVEPSRTAQPADQNDKNKEHPGIGAQLAKETREAEGEGDETAQFKQSASVRWLSRLTGVSLQHAYWLALLLNFLVIAIVLGWAARKHLPGIFRERTASIQRVMEEARLASEDANQRLREIESRLSRLDEEIASMKAEAEKDAAVEEERIKGAAEEDARKIVEAAEQEIASAVKAARRDLTAYAADLAIGLAKKQIHVDPGTDTGLVRSFAEKLAGAEGKN
jgi:F-type H+-transporting ATPase subunit b